MKHNIQRNLSVSKGRKARKSYYKNLDLQGIVDSTKFWATAKPLFSNKRKFTEYVTLERNGKIISNDKEVARSFYEFFVNIVPYLGRISNQDDPIDKAVIQYKSKQKSMYTHN